MKDQKFQEYYKTVCQGIWSPFMRRRIKKELLAHIEDIKKEKSLDSQRVIELLGDPKESNSLYRSLFYKKLKHDFFIYNGFFFICALIGIAAINDYAKSFDQRVKKETKAFMNVFVKDLGSKLFDFKENGLDAGVVLNPLVFENDGNDGPLISKYKNLYQEYVDKKISEKKAYALIDEKDLSWIESLSPYSYWSPVVEGLLGKKVYLSSFPVPNMSVLRFLLQGYLNKAVKKENRNQLLKAFKNYRKLSELLYSTETWVAHIVVISLLKKEEFTYKKAVSRGIINDSDWKPILVDYQARRNTSDALRALIQFNHDLEVVYNEISSFDSYEIGLCHAAGEFLNHESFYNKYLSKSLPLEMGLEGQTHYFEKIKEKVQSECRLSFLKYNPKPFDIDVREMIKRDDLHYSQIIPYLGIYIPYVRAFTSRWLASYGRYSRGYFHYEEKARRGI